MATRPMPPSDFPLAGSIELTTNCDLCCRHCYLPLAGAGRNDMPSDTARRLLDMLAEKGVLFLVLTGGEPLTHHDFYRIYRHAKHCGFLLTVMTNATLLDQTAADFFAAWPPRRLDISVYGHTEKTYEDVTGVPGSFRQFRKGVENALSRGLNVSLKMMVLRRNAHELHAVRQWAAELGRPFRFDAFVNPRLNGDRAPCQERLSPADVAQLMGTAEEDRCEFSRLKALSSALASNDRLFRCGAGLGTFHMDAQGRMHVCTLWRATPFDPLHPSPPLSWADHVRQVRQMLHPASSRCAACPHVAACGNCPAVSALEHGIPGMESPYYCKVMGTREKMFLEKKPVPCTVTS